MVFTSPTTKEEMYDTLQSIFYNYRLKRDAWENLELEPLTLDRLYYTKKPLSELKTIAQGNLASKKAREVLSLKQSLQKDIAVKQSEKQQKQTQISAGQKRIEQSYAKAKQEYLNWATKRGIESSEMVVKNLAQYDLKMAQEINEFVLPISSQIGTLDGEILQLSDRLNNAETAYDEIYNLEKEAMANELYMEQDKIEREVFKYNNSLEEKEQRYINSIKEVRARLEINYLEIDEILYTKEQLIEMGYYTDVIKCVSDYFNTLDAQSAYLSIVEEKRLAIYLDDYYQSLVYTYQCKAGF